MLGMLLQRILPINYLIRYYKMARAPRRANKGKKRTTWRPRRRNLRSLAAGGTEFASAKQNIELANDPVNALYRIDDINLSSFDRLSQIARAYQYFRFTKVVMKFKPLVDTFTLQGTGPGTFQSVPYLYTLINKSDTLNGIIGGFNGMRDAGCKPRRFDDKTITISWRPTVAQGVSLSEANNTTSYASYRTSPWLSTNANVMLPGGSTTWSPSTVPHLGLMYGVEQANTGDQVLPYSLEVEVHAQFKKPLQYSNEGVVAQKKELVAI